MFGRLVACLAAVAMLVSCAGPKPSVGRAFAVDGYGSVLGPVDGAGYGSLMSPKADGNAVQPDRMIEWWGVMTIEVDNVSNTVSQVVSMTEQVGGYISSNEDSGDKSARLTLRIPVPAFTSSMENLEKLGEVKSRLISSTDVTEDFIDTEARLKNKIVLRDRLQQLLDKATEVKDILAIETELNRIQSDIDSMEGRIKSLKNRVDFTTIDLTINKKPEEPPKPIYGPLGYLYKGAAWFIRKLFIIRE